ncbi:ADA2 [Sanghuangporus vaninii]
MTITQRKRTLLPDEIQAVSEPGLQIHCDSCSRDLTHSIRIKCADPVCEVGDGIDICPSCFCAGKEFKSHKRWHAYRIVELHSYPIFAEDWGADEELLLIEGIALQGLGNWQEIAKHVGTRTKEEVEEHYRNVYINSPNWPLPRMDFSFDVDPSTFHERKRRRISAMSAAVANSKPVPAPTSAPGVHDVATFLPGRLEFEHELDNDAEDLIKDLEFGVVREYGGEDILIDTNDVDVQARNKLEEERRRGKERGKALIGPDGREQSTDSVDVMASLINGYELANGHAEVRREKLPKEEGKDGKDAQGEGGETEEPVLPPPYETRDSVNFKLSLLTMYNQRVEKRLENKAIMFDRGLLEYKKMQALEKRRPKEEKDIAQRLKPLAKLQTADDYDQFVDGIIWESILRKRIQDLQFYRRMGLRTATDIERYELDVQKRAQAKANLAATSYDRLQLRVGSNRGSAGPDGRRQGSVGSFQDLEGAKDVDAPVRSNAPGSSAASSFIRRQPVPLNLANSPSLHLLTPAEQMLCSQLRIMPKPYLAMKETLVREYARRGGQLRRREARELLKIDVNKTSRVWDFLHRAGFLKAAPMEERENANNARTPAPTVNGSTPSLTQSSLSGSSNSTFATPRTSLPPLNPLNPSPGKESHFVHNPVPSWSQS